MTARNLRHLRLLLAMAETGSASRAAALCGVTQPAATQALRKMEAQAGQPLMRRGPSGLALTPAGEGLVARVRRALAGLDPALEAAAPRLRHTATLPQLLALAALVESRSTTLAARRLGLAQPTVHRAVAALEKETAGGLFERTAQGLLPRRPALLLARAVRLAMAELDQAEADLAELLGREVGRIAVGAMPLARASLLPQALAEFRRLRPTLPVAVQDGSYDDLLAGLRRGAIDFLIGALRDPAPAPDVEERALFEDPLVLLAGRGHPLAADPRITLEKLAAFPWVVPRPGTPARARFAQLFGPLDGRGPKAVIDSGSIVLMRELLNRSDHLGCISLAQAGAELAQGLLVALPFRAGLAGRPIGLTLRRGWRPTAAQADLLRILAAVRPPGLSAPAATAAATAGPGLPTA